MSKVVQGLMIVLGVALPGGTFVLGYLVLFSSATDPMKDRYHAVAAELLVPMFAAVVAALFTAGIIKGFMTLYDNRQRMAAGEKPKDIKFFDW
jgi:hypothetical protein